MELTELIIKSQEEVMDIRHNLAQLQELHGVSVLDTMVQLGKQIYLHQMVDTYQEDGGLHATTPVAAASLLLTSGDLLNSALPTDLLLIELNRIGDKMEVREELRDTCGMAPTYRDSLCFVIICAIAQLMMEDEEVYTELERRSNLAD